ncbi:mannose-6-phosphate isomerase, class I [Arachnia rubra]|mgnify:CR=1 FL=1|jgi:mannose-6-phosphate isomerase, class I|uniref:mannose-6-phosphate isomerase n=1 Tax=Arachnia rubra TaxID=1547448 RepID=A0ABX7Y2Y4_9ACTN|nr:mannose-6-phosphate isomerase, class I [Arachnia rubra]MDO4646172.1 mannose-6-phosphate isomerase, class I [Propionibacteriaceae bacterium]QUC07499.1 mannose-6-phosphate isomerase, class I [Arachnia rubra]BCR81795.1 mannose-6-phosphate isomerase, class I [Arachnia rubra]
MLELIGVRQSYPWGTKDAIPSLIGQAPDAKPWAEQWYGAHPLGDSPTPDGATLSEHLAQQQDQLGKAALMTFGRRLPFLMKILSAASPLSLQAHPTRQQAREGHARESLLGVPLGAPERSFKDDWPKPETIVALTSFEALVGFRDPVRTAQLFEDLGVGDALASVIGPLRDRDGSPALQEVFLDVLSLDDRRHLVDEVLGAAVNHLDAPGELGLFARTAVEIDEYFPSDPGILAALLLNRFSLEPGQALALAPGVMHSYLRGCCIEVMANSDNVLRGGLTAKHIDVDALLHVVSFAPTPAEVLLPSGSDGTYIYPTSFEEFELWLLQPTDGSPLQVPRSDSGRICLVASGSFELSGDGDPVVLKPGKAVFIGAEEAIVARGEGQLFVAATGV